MTLIEQIKHYNKAYRIGKPLVSDAEYDKLVEQLKREDPNNEWFQHIEPAVVTQSRKVKLPVPMKSLDKVKNITDLKKWTASFTADRDCRKEFVIMPKYDGLSLLHDEHTNQAFSRGGAENEGQDCTAHYSCLRDNSCSNLFNYTFGEFVFSREDWKRFKEATKDYTDCSFRSPRNTAAGLLNRDVPHKEFLSYVTFYRYGVDEKTLDGYKTFSEVLDNLCSEFKQPTLYKVVHLEQALDPEYMVNLFNEWNNMYPIDGLVVYINELSEWQRVGRHQTTGNPRYAIAYKDPSFTDSFETTVKSITWNVSKSGALKPVVNIDTVDTGDCNMENPTGYNAGWLWAHNITPGAKILVTRSGGVIPKILMCITPAADEEVRAFWRNMSICPACGAPLEWDDKSIELNCSNRNCHGKRIAKLCHFYTVCNAENMGEETITKLYRAGYNSISACLNLKFSDIVQIDTFGDETANVILKNNKRIMEGLDMATLMHASDCFQSIGKIKAQDIIESMDVEARSAFYNTEYDEVATWVSTRAKKSVTIKHFMQGLSKFYTFLLTTKIPVIQYIPQTMKAGVCSGMAICMSGFRDKDLENSITQQGGKIASGVSKNTTCLVVKDKNVSSSKIDKANALQIPILSIEEFENLYLTDLQQVK